MSREERQPSIFSPVFLPTLLRHFGFDDWGNEFRNWVAPRNGYSLSEDDSHVYLEVPMPGVDINDINITYDKGLVNIRSQSKKENNDNRRKYYERAFYDYAFTFALPGDVDEQQQPSAVYKKGVLTMTFSKTQKAQPKKITVQGE